MAYASRSKASAAYGENQVQADIAGVSDRFNMLHRIPMESGSFLTAGNSMEMVAVVDEQLAIELFGNTNVLGLYLELYGQHFKIIGVAEDDESIAGIMADDGLGRIYIPVGHLLLYDGSAMITSIEIMADDMGTTGINADRMKEGLASIGQNAADYRITDYNIEKKLLEEKAQAITFLSGAGLIIMLFVSVARGIQELFCVIKASLEKDYFKDALGKNRVKLLFGLLEITAITIMTALIWDAVRFNLYIPADYIPDELIDLQFFPTLAKNLMEKRVQGLGSIPSITEMKTGILSMLQGWNLAAAILAGYLPYMFGLRLLNTRQEKITGHMLYIAALIALSIAVSLPLPAVFKMPVTACGRELLIVSAFILFSVSGLRVKGIPTDSSRDQYKE